MGLSTLSNPAGPDAVLPERKPERESKEEVARLERLGVDLSRYPSVFERETFEPILSRRNRNIARPILRGYAARLTGTIPDPAMLTHIVTTRCNYSCGFCSFADTLNAKTDELSLEAIEKTYATIGDNLNVIVYSGGETTLNRDLPEIIEAAYRLTSVQSVYIISNAWKPERLLQITHRILQRCPDLHLTWSLSIEGPKAVNNRIRYAGGSQWDAWQNTVDAMEGMKAIRERFGYRALDVQLCTVCSPDNVDILHEWYETVRDELRPDKWNLNLMRRSVQMSGHTLTSFEARRSTKRLEPFEARYLEVTERVREDVLSGRLRFLYHTGNTMDGALKSATDLISQEENRRTVLEDSLRFPCRAGGFGAYIGSEGQVSACEEFAHNPVESRSFGNLRDVDYNFQALWRGSAADIHRAQVGRAPECRGCTLESQRNYPSILLSVKMLLEARRLGGKIL